MPQLIVGIIVIYLAYLFIKYVVLPGLAVLVAIALLIAAAGALWGLLCSLKNFIAAIRHNVTFKGAGA